MTFGILLVLCVFETHSIHEQNKVSSRTSVRYGKWRSTDLIFFSWKGKPFFLWDNSDKSRRKITLSPFWVVVSMRRVSQRHNHSAWYFKHSAYRYIIGEKCSFFSYEHYIESQVLHFNVRIQSSTHIIPHLYCKHKNDCQNDDFPELQNFFYSKREQKILLSCGNV